jgi:hypothetical protein
MFKKKKANAVKPEAGKPDSPVASSSSSVTMECGTPLSMIMGGYSYDLLTTASFRAEKFPDDNPQLLSTLDSYIVNAKTKIKETYSKNGIGYAEMFKTGETTLKAVREAILVLTPSAVREISKDTDMIDKALNTITIYDNGKRIKRNNLK